ncbi:MAG: monovalent cation/H+ antiporter subunit D family protein, partial [Gammaproteobacteria bacterium]|nr:monovalent cation/H+ antiporter subunit D family protein [Gammaproteobacteria bacterium]
MLFRIDALALLFLSLSAFLWLLTTIYAISYFGEKPEQSRFFGFFSLCVFATTGIALSGSLISF